ncbi:MAG: hypothetical protein ABWY78_00990, partial [Microvirga sp.]
GPASEVEIRRAYARRLKTLDLEQDGPRFQALIAARSHALQIASRLRPPSSDVREVMRVEMADAGIRPLSEFESGENRDDGDVWEPQDSDDHAEAAGEAWPNVLVPLHSTPDQEPDEARRPEMSEGRTPLRSVVDTPESEDPPFATIDERLNLLSADGWKSDLAPQWSALLKEMTDLPLGQARRFEPAALAAAATLALKSKVFSPLPWWKHWPRINRFRRPSRYTDRGYLQTMLGLASLYGWLASDRAVHEHLRHGDAVQTMVHFHAAQNAYRALNGLDPAPPQGRTNARALERDFEAVFEGFFDADDETSAELLAMTLLDPYKTYLRTGRWPMTWDWGVFWVAPAWAWCHRNKLLSALWVVIAVYVPIKATDLHYPVKQALILFSLWLTLCLHAWIAVYGYRGQIRHALRLIAKADQLHIFHPDLRATFLAGANPDPLGGHQPRPRLLEGPLSVILAIVYLLCGAKFLIHIIAVFVE